MNTTPEPTRRPIAWALAGAAVAVGLLRLLPESMKVTNLMVVGGLALFAGARLRGWQAFALPLAFMAVTDLGRHLAYPDETPFDPFVYASYGLYVAIGAASLRRTESPLKIGGGVLAASTTFFFVTNFGAWLMKALPEYTDSLATLPVAYFKGLPFHWPFLIGDAASAFVLFGAFAMLTRLAHSPETVRPQEVCV